MLDYFWDHQARILLVAPIEDGVFDLIQVERHQPRGAGQRILGYGSLSDNELGYVTFRLPEVPEGHDLRLLVQAFWAPGTARNHGLGRTTNEPLRLVNGTPPADLAETRIWTIFRGQDVLVADRFPHYETPPLDPVSDLWASTRNGNSLYPAYRARAQKTLQTIRMKLACRKDESGKLALPVQFDFRLSQVPTDHPRTDAKLTVYTLDADNQVLPLLCDREGHVIKRENEKDVTVRTDGEVEFTVPPKVEAGSDPNGTFIDYLDRIIIECRSPVSFLIEQEGTDARRLDSNGVCALLYAGDGKVVEDRAGILEKLVEIDIRPENREVFLIEMRAHEHIIDPADLGTATEITLLTFARTFQEIQYRYDAAQLLPLYFGDYTEAPCYFGLLADCPRVQDLAGLSRAIGVGLDEAERVGHLALRLLRDSLVSDANSVEARRIDLWAKDQLNQGVGWRIVPVALRDDIRGGVAAGLDWLDIELGVYIDLVSQPNIDDLKTLSDTLTDLGVLPLEMSKQFTPAEEAEVRLGQLRDLEATVVELIAEAEHDLELEQTDRRSSPSITEVLQNQTPGRRGLRKRTLEFFKDRLSALDFDLRLGREPLGNDRVIEILAAYFLDRVRHDCDMIEGIIKRGYPDALPYQLSKPDSLSSQPKPPRPQPLTDDQDIWLFGNNHSRPALVERWRIHVREAVRQFDS